MVCALAFTLAAAAPWPASAQPQSSSSPSPSLPPASGKSAEELYKEGVRLYEAKKWAEAERAFRAAWALNPTFDVAYNLGNATFRQGKHRDAAEFLGYALRVWPLLEATSALRPVAEKRLAESRTHVGALTVTVNVAGAEVLVDGQVVGKAPLAGEVFVEPGAHEVEVKLQGYVGDKETVQVEKGAAKAVELRLIQPMPMDASPVKKDAAAPPPSRASAEAPTEGGLRKPLIIAGIATSAALVTGGVVFAIVSSVKAGDAEDQRAAIVAQANGSEPSCLRPVPAPECKAIESTLSAQGTFANLSVWSFVVGGMLGAGTAIYGVTTAPRTTSKRAVQVVPMVSAEAGSVVIKGHW